MRRCGLALAGMVLAAGLAAVAAVQAQTRTRNELPFPDLPGLVTLRCNFHLHTAFPNGRVWPDARVTEAWQDGLDVIALTGPRFLVQPGRRGAMV